MVRQSLAGAAATMSLGVGSFLGGAAAASAINGRSNAAFISPMNQIRHSRESGNPVFLVC
jgi:hypothetical protein